MSHPSRSASSRRSATNEIKRRMRAVNEMRAYFAGLLPLRGSHPYIERKGLNLAGCGKVKVDGDLMVIPMFRHGALTSVQTIAPDGAKKYRYGCPSRGCSLELQHYGWAVTCLVEGFATGLAVYQSMPTARVLVCFDAGNMVLVAQELRLTGMCVVCADNDHATAARIGSNPGIEKGALAAGAIGCGMAYPDGIDGSDWCDALQAWGETGPAKLRMEIMRNARHVRPPG
jgi:putative DNA primase/helicase